MRQVLARPSPVKRANQRRILSKILWFILILIFLFIGLGLLSHLPKFMINEIDVNGTKILDKEELGRDVLEYLSHNKALFYARGNIFIFSKDEINQFIKNQFPRVWHINSIDRVKRKLNIDIEERQAAFIWCGNDAPNFLDQFKDKSCFFVDQSGFIFDHAPFFTNGVYLAIYGGIDKTIDPVGQTIATKNSIEDINKFVQALDNDNIPVHSLVLKETGQHELLLDIYTTIGDFPKIIFNEDASLDEIYNKLHSALMEPQFVEEFKDKGSTLEYIDTRFKNRVFYKFKDE